MNAMNTMNTMKWPHLRLAAATIATAIMLAACAGGPGSGYVGYNGGWAYDGYYDNYYGPIYDGYWGDDGYFWYRNSEGGHFHRGDRDHFRHDHPEGGDHWQTMHGDGHANGRMSMPHFHGGMGRSGMGRGGNHR